MMINAKLLLLILGTSLIACSCISAGPKFSPCIYSGDAHGAWCSPITGEPVYLRPDDQLTNYVCISPSDLEVVLDWIKKHEKHFP